jgi:hypothetical protein
MENVGVNFTAFKPLSSHFLVYSVLMKKDKVVLFYLLMLVVHLGHVLEEVWGRFWLIDAFFGLGWFLVANWLLFCIPVVFFYYVLHERRCAYRMSILYAGFMILQGVGHNTAILNIAT